MLVSDEAFGCLSSYEELEILDFHLLSKEIWLKENCSILYETSRMSVLFDKIMLQEIRVLMIAFEKGIFYVVALADDYNFVVVGV